MDLTTDFKASALKYHKARCRALSFINIVGAWSDYTSVGVKPPKRNNTVVPAVNFFGFSGRGCHVLAWDVPADEDYDHALIITDGGTGLDYNTSVTLFGEYPAYGCSFINYGQTGGSGLFGFTYKYWVVLVSKSGRRSEKRPNNDAGVTVTQGLAVTGFIAENAIVLSKVLSQEFVQRYQSATNTAKTIGTTEVLVESVLVEHGSDCDAVEIHLGFKNTSGATATFTVELRDGSGNSYFIWPTVQKSAADFFEVSRTIAKASLSGASTTFRLYVTATAAGQSINRSYLSGTTHRR
ncbi:hypothetical protein [Rhizobium alvei]|uniref:Jacalin-type lectin domain-containing protein n=1 Tax=Rhizobium alvei TaxID=1132659 RepID=A0ABT8YTC3_9HYPH|nr:hypothetical protein [Rhizobium alvei]MDO6967017.1 hypothetical protein [Rhizobium alvei]